MYRKNILILYMLNFSNEIWLSISIKHHYVAYILLILYMLNFCKEICVFISIQHHYVAETGHDKFICFLTFIHIISCVKSKKMNCDKVTDKANVLLVWGQYNTYQSSRELLGITWHYCVRRQDNDNIHRPVSSEIKYTPRIVGIFCIWL